MASLVSIIIPTCNMRRLVGEAIDSALAQTYPHVEVIVVDDGSTDGTGDYMQQRYGQRVRYSYQPNQGRGAARNRGLRLAEGDYIQFLDADDLLYAHKLEAQVSFLETHPENAAVYGNVLVAYEDDMEHPWAPELQAFYVSGDILEQEIHQPFLWTNAVLVRRAWVERVKGFDEALRSNEDWDLWLRIAAGGQFAYLQGEAVALYRARRKHSARASVHLQSGVQVLVKLRNAMSNPAQRRSLRIDCAIGHWMFGYGKALADEGERLKGLRQMIRSLALDRRSLAYKLLSILVLALFPPAQGNRLLRRAQVAKDAVLRLPKAII